MSSDSEWNINKNIWIQVSFHDGRCVHLFGKTESSMVHKTICLTMPLLYRWKIHYYKRLLLHLVLQIKLISFIQEKHSIFLHLTCCAVVIMVTFISEIRAVKWEARNATKPYTVKVSTWKDAKKKITWMETENIPRGLRWIVIPHMVSGCNYHWELGIGRVEIATNGGLTKAGRISR